MLSPAGLGWGEDPVRSLRPPPSLRSSAQGPVEDFGGAARRRPEGAPKAQERRGENGGGERPGRGLRGTAPAGAGQCGGGARSPKSPKSTFFFKILLHFFFLGGTRWVLCSALLGAFVPRCLRDPPSSPVLSGAPRMPAGTVPSRVPPSPWVPLGEGKGLGPTSVPPPGFAQLTKAPRRDTRAESKQTSPGSLPGPISG